MPLYFYRPGHCCHNKKTLKLCLTFRISRTRSAVAPKPNCENRYVGSEDLPTSERSERVGCMRLLGGLGLENPYT
jgi:hypothetical protein